MRQANILVHRLPIARPGRQLGEVDARRFKFRICDDVGAFVYDLNTSYIADRDPSSLWHPRGR